MQIKKKKNPQLHRVVPPEGESQESPAESDNASN